MVPAKASECEEAQPIHQLSLVQVRRMAGLSPIYIANLKNEDLQTLLMVKTIKSGEVITNGHLGLDWFWDASGI